MLADASAFLPPPVSEIPAAAPPSASAQESILSKAAENLASAVHKLPDFLAQKTTTRFHDLKLSYLASGEPIIVEDGPMQFLDVFSGPVYYRDGREVEEADEQERQSTPAPRNGLLNWGVFGPVLRIVVTDIYKGRLEWSRWEEYANAQVAVFRYEIPREKSDYVVKFCCLGQPNTGLRRFESMPAFHGEIAIDTVTGAVYRLVLIAELSAKDPISLAQIMVEYEPVEIGGKMYIYPRKSVTMSVASVEVFKEGNCWIADCTPPHSFRPKDTAINDTVYGSYHVFRSESRILPAGNMDQP